ncbi:MAG: hypothetical protein Kow0080_12800 [Candidatus Promineifilaceae bacterium]
MNSKKNTAVWLVDVGYVVKASEGKFKLDYLRAEKHLESLFGKTKTFLFNGFDTAYGIPPGLQAFYDVMERQGMIVRLQPMQSGAPGTNQQRRVDVDFSAHLVWQASIPHINPLIITTGDQDFVPAIEVVHQAFQKNVILFSYDAMVHTDLINSVNDRLLFEDHRQQVARK